jgi:Spy/CpxP family protein refolding chaperone
VSESRSCGTLPLLAATTLALGLTMPAFAQSGGPGFVAGHRAPAGGMQPRPGSLFGPMTQPLAFARGLQLNGAQEDQIFRILHASAPAMREHHKAVQRARATLDELVRADTYDTARARELAEAEGKARVELSLARAETLHLLRQVLTAEQRATLDQRERGTGKSPR